MFTAVSLLIVAMLSIQTGAGFAKFLFPQAGAAGTTALRLFFATLVLCVIWRPWRHRFDRRTLRNLSIYGASLGLMNLTFYFALDRIPLGLAVTLEFIGPLALSIFSSRKKIDFLWAVLAAIGIYLVMPSSDASQASDLLGIAWALIAGMFWAFYIYFGQRAGNQLHGGIATTMGMLIASFVAIPFGLVIDGEKLLNPKILPLAILVALLSSALPYSMEMVAMKRIPTKTFGILMSLEPAIASLTGLVLLKETLLPAQWFAILFIIAASFGSALSSRERTKA